MKNVSVNGRCRDPLTVMKNNIDQIRELASLNLSIQKICACIGISLTAFYNHKDAYPEIDRAIEEGRAMGVQKVAEALKATAQKGNVTAQIFYLKNADPEMWNKESTTINQNITANAVEELSDADLEKQIKKLEQQEEKTKSEA